MKLKKFIMLGMRKILYGSQATSEGYAKYLRSKGVRIGENIKLFSPETLTIDVQNPHLLTIGNNVRITKGCSILTHDYSYSVLAGFGGGHLQRI